MSHAGLSNARTGWQEPPQVLPQVLPQVPPQVPPQVQALVQALVPAQEPASVSRRCRAVLTSLALSARPDEVVP